MRRHLGAICVFVRLMKKLRRRTRRCVLKSIGYFFFAWNRPSAKYIYEQNSRPASGEFRREKRKNCSNLKEAPKYRSNLSWSKVHRVYSHDYSVFFIIICLYIIIKNWTRYIGFLPFWLAERSQAISSYTCCDQIWTMNTQQQNEQSELEVFSSQATRREK